MRRSIFVTSLTIFIAAFSGISSVNAAVITLGNSLIDRSTNDSANGAFFVMLDPISVQGTVTDWAFFDNDDFSDGPGGGNRALTPLILELVSSDYIIRGIGTTRTSTEGGVQSNPFGLVSGSAAVDTDFFFGYKDGTNGINNPGVADWDSVDDFGVQYFGVVSSFAVNDNLGAGIVFLDRQYSIQFSTSITSTPEPSTFVLAALGLLGLIAYTWRRRRRQNSRPQHS